MQKSNLFWLLSVFFVLNCADSGSVYQDASLEELGPDAQDFGSDPGSTETLSQSDPPPGEESPLQEHPYTPSVCRQLINLIVKNALDAVCQDKEDYCCSCHCWADAEKSFDARKYYDTQVCECLYVHVPEPPCEGREKSDAEKCLVDATCVDDAVQNWIPLFSQECDGTPL